MCEVAVERIGRLWSDVESDGSNSNHRLRGGIRDNLRGSARPHCNAETAFQDRHEPQNGGHHGNFSDPLGDLRRVNRFEEHHHVECDRGRD